METITLKLTEFDVKSIITVLGQLATNTGAYPLMVNIETQLNDALSNKKQDED